MEVLVQIIESKKLFYPRQLTHDKTVDDTSQVFFEKTKHVLMMYYCWSYFGLIDGKIHW